jgi:hypothetical protein
MKTISPITSWNNGQSVQATILNSYATNVTLGYSADFYYGLLNETLGIVAIGNLTMTGEAYQKWSQDSYAWDWVATTLGLTITGEYVPPVVETIAEPIVETIVETPTAEIIAE